MNETIYKSSNEDGLLKSIGPYRVISADKSISGIKFPESITVSSPLQFGTTLIYGVMASGEKEVQPVNIEQPKHN